MVNVKKSIASTRGLQSWHTYCIFIIVAKMIIKNILYKALI